jgi:hypothetical protein
VRLDQRFDPLITDKLDIRGPAPPQRRNKHRELVAAPPDNSRPASATWVRITAAVTSVFTDRRKRSGTAGASACS